MHHPSEEESLLSAGMNDTALGPSSVCWGTLYNHNESCLTLGGRPPEKPVGCARGKAERHSSCAGHRG